MYVCVPTQRKRMKSYLYVVELWVILKFFLCAFLNFLYWTQIIHNGFWNYKINNFLNYSDNEIFQQNSLRTDLWLRAPKKSKLLTFSHNALGHPWSSSRGNSVTMNVAFLAFNCKGIWKAQKTQLCSTVIGLAKVAIYSWSWCRHNNPKRKIDLSKSLFCVLITLQL